MEEEARLLLLFKAAALLGYERGEEAVFQYLKYAVAVG
jgi:hypothetical protein